MSSEFDTIPFSRAVDGAPLTVRSRVAYARYRIGLAWTGRGTWPLPASLCGLLATSFAVSVAAGYVLDRNGTLTDHPFVSGGLNSIAAGSVGLPMTALLLARLQRRQRLNLWSRTHARIAGRIVDTTIAQATAVAVAAGRLKAPPQAVEATLVRYKQDPAAHVGLRIRRLDDLVGALHRDLKPNGGGQDIAEVGIVAESVVRSALAYLHEAVEKAQNNLARSPVSDDGQLALDELAIDIEELRSRVGGTLLGPEAPGYKGGTQGTLSLVAKAVEAVRDTALMVAPSEERQYARSREHARRLRHERRMRMMAERYALRGE